MKDALFQKRHFILSSFVRLKITLTSDVYRFCDKIIREEWIPPLGSLNDVDKEILQKYQQFTYNG
jgi:hypothetical protein